MTEHIGGQEEDILEEKASRGQLSKGEEQIPNQDLELPLDSFPELDEEKEGDRVVLVVAGNVKGKGKDSLVVELTRASIVHGKMHGEFGTKRLNRRLERFNREVDFARPREEKTGLDQALTLDARKKGDRIHEKRSR